MLSALLERQAGGADRGAAEALLEPSGRQTRGQGPASGAVRAARQAQGAGRRDPARSRAARGARAAADEPAGGGQRHGLLPVAPSVARRRATPRAVRPRAANAAREARARAAAGRRDGEAPAAARRRQGKDCVGLAEKRRARGRRAGSPRAKAREHEQHPAPVPRGRAQATDRRARRAAGRCSRRSSRSCVRSPRRFRASRCRSRKGCRSTAGGSSTPPSSRSLSTSCVHFSEHDLASLAKTSTERAVADMKFGDRRDCDRMVERIREKIEELKQQKTFADQVKRRTDLLLAEVKYRNDTDSVPSVESLQMISRTPGAHSQRARDGAARERRAATASTW